MKGDGYLATDIFGELAGLRGFVDSNCSLLFISIYPVNVEKVANLQLPLQIPQRSQLKLQQDG
jgi:hypothetical protein